MSRVNAKIQELLAKFEGQEISISTIRKELQDEGDLNDSEISMVCQEISDAKLAGLNKNKLNVLGFFNSIYIAYFLSIAFIILAALAVYKIIELRELQSLGEVASSMILWRYFLLAGSILFLIRNVSRVVRHMKSK